MAQLTTPGGRGTRRRIQIDMTPMVDLAFLLLTFFVLTTTLNKKYVLEVVKPEEDKNNHGPTIHQDRVLTLLLGDQDKIHFFQGADELKTTDYSPEGIRALLIDSKARREDLVVLIKPMSTSRYQNLVDIIDEIDTTHTKPYYLVKETAADRALIEQLPVNPL